MKYLLFFIVILSLAIGAIQFKPIAYISHFSTGSDRFYEDTPISIFGAGLQVGYNRGNIKIDAIFLNHRLWGISAQQRSKYNSFNDEQGLSWGQDPMHSGNSFDYDFADLNVRYKMDGGELFFGKMNPKWGTGNSKLVLSDNSPSFPLFGFSWHVNEMISMEYFHGNLISGMKDSIYANYYVDEGGNNRSFNVKRSITAHRFELQLNDKIKFIGSETVIYALRGVDIHYLIPMIPFWSLQHYLGDTDNIQMAGEIIYSASNRLKFYGTIFMDEWAPEKTFEKENRNWFAYQGGLTWTQLLADSDQFRLEFTWTDSRVYRHRFEVNDFYSHGFPLGFWAGPHADELFISYNLNFLNMEWLMELSDAKRGKFISLENQYDNSIDDEPRYEGVVEEKLFIGLEVTRPVYRNLFMTAGISYVNWENAGFDPGGGDNQDLQDIEKKSFNLSFSYNY
jgi:hypothetical protein